MGILLLKLSLVPALIAGITWAGRRWGPTVAGWLTGLPIVAGPIMYFIAWEQGDAFAAQAVVGMLLGVAAVFAFNLGFAWACTRFAWPTSLLLAYLAYALAIAGLERWTPSLAEAALLVLAGLAGAPRVFPQRRASGVAPPTSSGEIALRMAAGAALVLAVTFFAATFGAHLSGLFATFPVISTVLAVFTLRQSGASFTVCVLRGIAFGWYAFLAFCLALGWVLPLAGRDLAFLAAIAAAGLTQVATRRLLGRFLG